MAEKFEKLLGEYRQRLKTAQCSVTIERRKQHLVLRGVFPPKPGSQKSEPYTQRYPLKARPHEHGLRFAFKRAKEIDVQLLNGTFKWDEKSPRSGFDEFLDAWERYSQFRASELEAPATVNKMYRPVASHLRRFGRPIDDRQTALRFIDDLRSQVSDESAKKYVGMLKRFYEWRRSRGQWDAPNPFDDLGASIKFRRTAKTKRDALTEAEVKRVLEAVRDSKYYSHYYPFIRFLFFTGIRPSEAVALQWRHIGARCEYIDIEEALVSAGGGGRSRIRKKNKTARWRRFPCGKLLQELLKSIKPKHAKPDTYVFVSPKGKPIDPHNVARRCWKSCLEAAGVRYRKFYIYRSTFISHALKKGIDPYEIAEIAGHNPKILFDHYADIIKPIKGFDLDYEH